MARLFPCVRRTPYRESDSSLGGSREQLMGCGISRGLIHTFLSPDPTTAISIWNSDPSLFLSLADSRRDCAELIAFTHLRAKHAMRTQRWSVWVTERVRVQRGVCVREKSQRELDCLSGTGGFACLRWEYAWVHMCICLHMRSCSRVRPPGASRSPIPWSLWDNRAPWHFNILTPRLEYQLKQRRRFLLPLLSCCANFFCHFGGTVKKKRQPLHTGTLKADQTCHSAGGFNEFAQSWSPPSGSLSPGN